MKGFYFICLSMLALATVVQPNVVQERNGLKRGGKNNWKSPENWDPSAKCAHLIHGEQKQKAVQQCATRFGIELLTLNPRDQGLKPESSEVNNTDVKFIETKLEEIDEHFRQLVANFSHKIPKDANNWPVFKMPRKIAHQSCFGVCIMTSVGMFRQNNTFDEDLLKTQLEEVSEGKITANYANKIIHNCYKRSGLNSTSVVELPKSSVADSDSCRQTLKFAMCLARSSWEVCRLLSDD